MVAFTPRDLTERLHGIFSPIFKFWQQTLVVDSHLRDLVGERSIHEVLIKDVTDIGMYFATADSLSARAELVLIAEYVSWLQAEPLTSARQREKQVTALTESLGDVLKTTDTSQIFAPLCWRIAQICLIKHHYSQDAVFALRDTLLAIGDHFCLHDGNLTPAESERLKAYQAVLDA
tara:strand:- start:769 stop:1296 length:528 start_codon:yes stop_codon:yes gene_type:complete